MYTHAVIVLGCGIDAAGTLGSDAMSSVQIGLDTLKQHDDACLVMSGDVSYKATFAPSISEAQAMKDFAVAIGASADQIFVETESKDSLGNLFFTKQNVLLPLGITSVSIVLGPNQSGERVAYLAKKVLGEAYDYTVIESTTRRPNESVREQASLALAKRWLGHIQDGDMQAIYHVMRSKHPGYNSSINLDTLQQLL